MDTLDPKKLSLSKSSVLPVVSRNRRQKSNLPRHQLGEKFLKGPIPLALINRATKLPGKAWHVYAAVWYLAGVRKDQTIKLTQVVLNEFGVSRYAKYRALDALAQEGLILYESADGKKPLVTLLNTVEGM